MTSSLEKLLSPGATGTINRILREKYVLGYRYSIINYFTKSKIFSGVRFLSFFTKL